MDGHEGHAHVANAKDNAPISDNLDEMERKYLAANDFMAPEADEMNRYEIDSDFSIDDDLAHLEEEQLYERMMAAPMEDEGDWSTVLSSNRPKNNTGGKGVLADHKEATAITRRRNETKNLKQREAWKKAGYAQSAVSLKKDMAENKPSKSRDADDDEEDDDEDEEAFFEKFRMLRMQQLSSVAGLPQFGRVLEVGKFEFVDEVDQADPRTYVVVHLYEEYLLACQRMNTILGSMASRFPHVKFLRLKATEADQTLSHSVLPAFLVYKGGKVVGRAAVDTAKTEFQNEKFTEDDVEYMLVAKYGVHLPGVDVSDREKSQKAAEENELGTHDALRSTAVAEWS